MITAIVAVAALLLPSVALYLGIGIVAGPLLLRHVNRAYDVPVDHLRDTPVAIVAWVVILARVVLAESEPA